MKISESNLLSPTRSGLSGGVFVGFMYVCVMDTGGSLVSSSSWWHESAFHSLSSCRMGVSKLANKPSLYPWKMGWGSGMRSRW